MVIEYIGRALQVAVVLLLVSGLWNKPIGQTLESLLPVASNMVD